MSKYDFAILGAGFAGLSLADALQQENQKVVIIEKNEPGSGASGTPGALVNPATGRKGKKSWKAEACYKAIRENLEKIQKSADTPFFHQNGVLRPAQTKKMARKMKAQFDKTNWPDGWCFWLNEDEVKKKHSGIHCVDGGLWLPIGLTVDGSRYCRSYAKWLLRKGVNIETNCDVSIKQKDGDWDIQAKNLNIECKNIIFATGYDAILSRYWKGLKLEPIKGQLALFQIDKKLSFSHSVSGLGYVARLDDPHKFIQGSTYEHNFETLETNSEGVDYLKNRLKRMLPDLAKEAKLISQWSGVRVSAPNRKPIAGSHGNYKNLYIFTGLGSKGLLYSKFVASHFVNYLLNKTPLSKEISIHRLQMEPTS